MRPLLSITLFFIHLISFGQKETKRNAYVNVDHNVVTHYKDSLLFNKTREVIIFQTIRSFNYIKSSDSLLTFIIWQQRKYCSAIVISNTNIYLSENFNGKPIFEYPKKTLTFVSKDEEGLKFTPPIIGNVVYLFTRKSDDYFELTGSNSQPWTYIPTDTKKEIARKEYFDIIFQILNQKLNFKIKSIYQRQL